MADSDLTSSEQVIPHSFLCPITQSILIDPVTASDGFTYERSAIERWFRTSDKSPVTGLKITRNYFPNHALRGAIQELFPGQVATARAAAQPAEQPAPVEVPETDVFVKTRQDILTACKARYANLPQPGTVYYGIFEQHFVRGDSIAKSRWTVRMEFNSIDEQNDPPSLMASLIWRKHEQVFEPSMQLFLDHDFATRLLGTVGGMFECKVRGTFCRINGALDMYTYEGTNVGIGFYKLLLGSDTLDGCFFLPDFEDVGNPSTHGMGVLRLIRHLSSDNNGV